MPDVNTAPLSGTDAASDAANTPFPIADPGAPIAPSQPPPPPDTPSQPSPAPPSDAPAPKGSMWHNILRGALYGLTNTEGQSRGAVGGVISGITGQEPQLEARYNQQQQVSKDLLNFESVKAADSHIAALDQHRRADQLSDEAKLDYSAKSADYQAFLQDHFGIAPDLSFNDSHNEATAGLTTTANNNGGTIPPVTAVLQPAADGQHGKIAAYSPSQQQFNQNMSGYRNLINTVRSVQGMPPVDDASFNSMGFKGARDQALQAIEFLKPTPTFSLDKNSPTYLPTVLAQKQQQLQQYENHKDANGNKDADPSVLKQLQGGIDYLQKSWDSTNQMESDQAKKNASAAAQGKIDTETSPANVAKQVGLKTAEEQAANKVKQMFDNKPVYAVDSTGKTVMTTQSAVNSNTNAYTSVRPVKETDVRADQHDIKVLNDIQTKSDAVKTAASSMDSTSWGQAVGVAKYLEDHPDTTSSSITNAKILQGLSPQARTYVINVLSLRESAMGLQKVLTGSARSNDAQIKALQATLPGFESNSQVVGQKLGAFDQNLGMLSQGLPENTGVAIQVKPPQAAPKVGETKQFPNGKTGKWDGNGWVAQ